MFKRFFAFVVAMIMMLSCMLMSVYAEDGVLELTIPEISLKNATTTASSSSTLSGSGTKSNPYKIYTEDDLLTINTYPTKYFELQNDIVVDYENWIPIGYSTEFSGYFNGNGYTVSGVKLYESGYDYTGFFGQNTGTIENLTVSVDFSSSNGCIGGLVAYNKGTIKNCKATGKIESLCNYAEIGGLVGSNYYGTISLSSSNASLTATTYGNTAGGLIGRSYYGSVSLSSSNSSISMPNNSGYSVGGLIGENTSPVTNCYAQGSVSAGSVTGGFIGYNESTVTNCYASGKVNDGDGSGLISSNSGEVYNCYYCSTNSGSQTGFAVSTANLKKQSTFYYWDFDNIWDISGSYPFINVRGETEDIEFEGYGDEDDPYLIETEQQLHALAMGYAKTGAKIYYQLANDITVTALYWMPIGEYTEFTGTFDGNGHTISGIKLSGTDYSYVGLFGKNAGTIKNLTVNSTVSGNGSIGGLSAYNKGTISNCKTSGKITSTANYADIGGLVGYNYYGIVDLSSSNASLTATTYGNTAGGLIGRSYYGSVSLSSSNSSISIPNNGGYSVGGLIGENTSPVTNCYAQGSISAGSVTGGLIGYNESTVTNCYASGSSSDDIGLIYSNSGTIYSCYYNKESLGQPNDIGTGVSTADMQKQSTYIDWDFSDTWGISSSANNGYPFLLALDDYVPDDPTTTTTATTESTTESTTKSTTTTTKEITTETTTNSEVFDFIPTEAVVAGSILCDGTKAIVEAVQALNYKTGDSYFTVNGRSYLNYLQSTSVNTTLTIDGTSKKYRISIKITAKEDTTIRIDHKIAPGKTVFILKGDLTDGGTAEVVDSKSNDSNSSIYDTFTVSLNAGDVIYYVGQGTDPVFYAIDGLGESVDSTTTTSSSTTQVTTTTTTKESTTESTTKATTTTTKETSTESTTKTTTSTTKETSTESTTQSPDSNININITSKKALRGDYVDIPVAISNNPGICYFNIWITYDKTKLQPVSYTKNPAFSTIISNIDNNINNGNASFLWNDGANAQNSILNGNAFTIKFLVLEDAEVGESTLSVNTARTEFYYPDLSDCGYTYTNGSVNITNVRKGDINLDGKINIKDLLVLTQYNAGWIDTLTDDALDAADVTGDGKVNGADLIILSRYLAGWVSVTL